MKQTVTRKKVDWTEVHRQLEATTAAMERVITPGIDDTKRLLKE